MELECLQNPYNGLSLRWTDEYSRTGLTDGSGVEFPIRNGYPNFLAGHQVTGLNHTFQRFYDRIGRLAGILGRRFFGPFDIDHLREEWLHGIDIHPGDRVLEVAVGTAQNLRHLPRHARYFGVDISSGMLNRGVRNVRKWGIPVELCQANAEYLPYRDNTFDLVFHIGGINFFNDRGRAIREMIRVARPGAPILIIDETARELKAWYRKSLLLRSYLRHSEIDRSRLYAPAAFVPGEIRDVEVKLINNGAMYRLSFEKPLNLLANKRVS